MFNFLTYNKFKDAKWSHLSNEKRLKVFQKMEKIMARKVGRPVYKIVPKNWTDGTMGLCTYGNQTIYLHTDYFVKNHMQFFGLATLFHEQRHAQQHFVVKSKKKFFKFSKAYRWRQNMLSYIKYEGNEKYSYYSMQNIERDANKFAIKNLKKFAFRFRKERVFTYTLLEKEKQFNYVKEKAKKELGIFYKWKLFIRRKKEEKKLNKK